ncbi:uncharacterized protein F5147DRAFT_642164 [Suillus discolor]|uniref:ATPase AAA-type core domain-containing protein n=1 Tax=Suillus discolor TaxID=1912936 RepID=A0A9P7EWH0_9AGAM|nr:uncharacterized protein F5147DRAFT_642164 [Suillus discolor]KAG2095118.1 hypothetical protein F5147DRAFT_642164 [Suillus discolor]
MEHPCILLLDELTSHLDMTSIDALALAIKDFEGGVVIVSSNFLLISQVAEELWEVADKTIHNLAKDEISIVDYKRNLVKHSTVSPPSSDRVLIVMQVRPNCKRPRLISKSATKWKR